MVENTPWEVNIHYIDEGGTDKLANMREGGTNTFSFQNFFIMGFVCIKIVRTVHIINACNIL